jgi:hypothetical protein
MTHLCIYGRMRVREQGALDTLLALERSSAGLMRDRPSRRISPARAHPELLRQT